MLQQHKKGLLFHLTMSKRLTYKELLARVRELERKPEAGELFKIKSAEFDLVVTDMTMPLISGDQQTQEKRKIKQEIPIIICTGNSNKMNDNRAQQIGINAFV